MKRIICALVLIHALFQSYGQDRKRQVGKLIPDYAQIQFAGNLGLVSAGAGYNMVRDKLHIGLLDGYVPPSGNRRGINIISIKGSYDIIKLDVLKNKRLVPYSGLAVSYETTGNSFILLPDYYDARYYNPTAIRTSVFVGGKIEIPTGNNGQRLDLCIESGTMDVYLYHYFRNKGLNFTEMFSGAIGLAWHFTR